MRVEWAGNSSKTAPSNIALRGAILDRLKGGVCDWGQTSPRVIILPHVEMERLVRNDGQPLWAPEYGITGVRFNLNISIAQVHPPETRTNSSLASINAVSMIVFS